MKRFTLFLLLMMMSFFGMSQNKTTSGVTGNWSSTSVWSDGYVPPTTSIPSGTSGDINYVINGTVGVGTFPQTNSITMDFSNNKDTYNFTVNGTLVVYGNMTFGNSAMNLIIPAGGIVIIMGDLTTQNKITLNNGGILVVKGTATFAGGSGQNDYVDNGGKFWPLGNNGVVAGNNADPQAQTAATTSGNFATVASTSIQNIVNGSINPLPIKLLSFIGNAVKGKVDLSWSTSSELNFDYFEVERSGNAKDFTSIGKVTGNGTSTIRHDYTLADEKPLIGRSYYRLKSVDFDSYTEYFKVIGVDFSTDKMFDVSPNPTDGTSIRFTMNFIPEGNTDIIVYDNFSNVVAHYAPSESSQFVEFSNPLKSGMYYAKILSGDFVKVQRFVVR
ncbi:MAG TPA: T9SS type A sorting domain-containing protein [Cyclobacteriaceae bacterium]|nr:T9SS type A sorting domain-containing protein [Cyclobacteriaceae bacterium]